MTDLEFDQDRWKRDLPYIRKQDMQKVLEDMADSVIEANDARVEAEKKLADMNALPEMSDERPLPEPAEFACVGGISQDVFTADQMRAYLSEGTAALMAKIERQIGETTYHCGQARDAEIRLLCLKVDHYQLAAENEKLIAQVKLWSNKFADGCAERDQLATQLRACERDAQQWGNALNKASWKFMESYREHMEEAVSAKLFNLGKTILRDAILCYVASITPPPGDAK